MIYKKKSHKHYTEEGDQNKFLVGKKLWLQRCQLRGHLDSVRSVGFLQQILFSGSEVSL